MDGEFWMVWNEHNRAPIVKHPTAASAAREAERLARAHGGTFHVLHAVATCTKNDVVWLWLTRELDNEIPF